MNNSDMPKNKRVLFLIDFINPFDFSGSENMTESVLKAAIKSSARLNGWHFNRDEANER